MIHLFNRKELMITWSIQELAQVRDILASNHVEYRVRTVNTSRTASAGSGSRARTGTAGLRTDVMYQYYIYVKKEDYEKAKYLIGR